MREKFTRITLVFASIIYTILHKDNVFIYFLEVEDDLTSINEQEQDLSQDRNTSKRRYSRLSDGYERLKTVLPSVKDKRRVSKVTYVFMYDFFC